MDYNQSRFLTAEQKKEKTQPNRKTVRPKPERRVYGNEHEMQVALVKWAKESEGEISALGSLYSIPNAAAKLSNRLQLEGIKAGVPDLCLAWPSGPFHSLYIEMKSGDHKLSPEQEKWKERLIRQGFYVGVCRKLESAKNLILTYLGHPEKLVQ